MADAGIIKIATEVTPPPQPPVKWGPASILTTVFSFATAAGAVYAGIEGADSAMVLSGAGSILSLGLGMGGRIAQAIALTRSAVTTAGPWIDLVQKALETPAPGQVLGEAVVAPAVQPVNVTVGAPGGLAPADLERIVAEEIRRLTTDVDEKRSGAFDQDDDEDDLAASIPDDELPDDDDELEPLGLTGRVADPDAP